MNIKTTQQQHNKQNNPSVQQNLNYMCLTKYIICVKLQM